MASLTYISPAEIDDRFTEVIDVRSPGEFAEDHLPGAINLPVLDDTERAEVGTLYKQVNPFVARKVGAAKIARNVATYLEGVLAEKPPNYRPLLYCWRGGQRSASMATILSEVGWPVNVVKGGYDGYRRFVREGLEETTREGHLDFRLIGGLTGSGKTVLLDALTEAGHQVLDLEGLGEPPRFATRAFVSGAGTTIAESIRECGIRRIAKLRTRASGLRGIREQQGGRSPRATGIVGEDADVSRDRDQSAAGCAGEVSFGSVPPFCGGSETFGGHVRSAPEKSWERADRPMERVNRCGSLAGIRGELAREPL